MEVKKFTLGPVLTNMYVVSKNGHGFIVDCADRSLAVDKYIEDNNITIDFILQTHTHFDHVLGLEYYKEKYGVEVYGGHKAADIANDKNYNLGFDFPDLYVPIDNYVGEGDKITDFEIKVLDTPGHSLDSISFLIADKLFAGDALFNLSIGRTDLPGGNYGTLINSILTKFGNLDRDTLVFPGHGENTTIGYEFDNNPFLI